MVNPPLPQRMDPYSQSASSPTRLAGPGPALGQSQNYGSSSASSSSSATSPSRFGGGPYPNRLPSPSPSALRSYPPPDRIYPHHHHPHRLVAPLSSSSMSFHPYSHIHNSVPSTSSFPLSPSSHVSDRTTSMMPPSGLTLPLGPRLPPFFQSTHDPLQIRPLESPYSSKDARAHDDPTTGSSRTHETNEDERSPSGSPPKRKRARPGAKITRNRKITSCLPCRERKQKCDRNHPICRKCIDDGRQCVYVTSGESIQGTSNSPEIVKKSQPVGADRPEGERRGFSFATSSVAEPSSSSSSSLPMATFLQQRRDNIAATWKAGRDRTLCFSERVEAARAAAVAEVLFAENGAADLKLKGTLLLPTRVQVQPLLDIYKRDVECFTAIVLVDLNRPRIESFLDWWHSNPVTLPVDSDAPLAPLVLTILALALQAKRTRDATDGVNGSRPQQDSHLSGNDKILDFMSSERLLLETAGRCMNSLTIACPSAWNSTYSSPLDVVRAELLRALWHIGECHLQFASNCISTALRLAYAAGLHRDPTHWKNVKMSSYEVQARRSIWWNVAFFETFHSHRTGQPSSINPATADTELPTDFGTIQEQYRCIPYECMTQNNFNCMLTQLHMAQLFLQNSRRVFGLHLKPREVVRSLGEIYTAWVTSMPDELQRQAKQTTASDGRYRDSLSSSDKSRIGDGNSGNDLEENWAFRWQIFLLRIHKLQALLNVHRPASDLSTGCAETEAQAMQSLQVCLEAAARSVYLCHEAVICRPAPPFLLLSIISYHAFNAGCILASQFSSQSALSNLSRPAYQKALAVLDHLANNQSLGNTSEQAERYGAAVREIAASPEMFHKKPTPASHQPPQAEYGRGETNVAQGQLHDPVFATAETPRLPSGVPGPPASGSSWTSSEASRGMPMASPLTPSVSSSSRASQRSKDLDSRNDIFAPSQFGRVEDLEHHHLVPSGRPYSTSASDLTDDPRRDYSAPPGDFLFTGGGGRSSSSAIDRPLPNHNPITSNHYGDLMMDSFGDPSSEEGNALAESPSASYRLQTALSIPLSRKHGNVAEVAEGRRPGEGYPVPNTSPPNPASGSSATGVGITTNRNSATSGALAAPSLAQREEEEEEAPWPTLPLSPLRLANRSVAAATTTTTTAAPPPPLGMSTANMSHQLVRPSTDYQHHHHHQQQQQQQAQQAQEPSSHYLLDTAELDPHHPPHPHLLSSSEIGIATNASTTARASTSTSTGDLPVNVDWPLLGDFVQRILQGEKVGGADHHHHPLHHHPHHHTGNTSTSTSANANANASASTHHQLLRHSTQSQGQSQKSK